MSSKASENRTSFQPLRTSGPLVASPLNFEDFIQSLETLRKSYGHQLLFRGHADSTWNLSTTLERNGVSGMRFDEYYRLTCAVGPEVNAFAHISAPEYSQTDIELFSDPQLLIDDKFPPSRFYPYLAYLRHHGFPSPLLDWSLSPFVAVFFAFREQNKAQLRAIFAYCDSPDGLRKHTLGNRVIRQLGPYVQTHHRHFRQQCNYTVCAKFDNTEQQWHYDSHQEAFQDTRNREHGLLWKFEILSSERDRILKHLNDYNLNAFSLFGSEEGLLETMWHRQYTLKQSKSTERSDLISDSPLQVVKKPPFGVGGS